MPYLVLLICVTVDIPASKVKKAIANVEINFQHDPFLMRGFYRDIRSQNDKTVHLVEAALEVKDQGFSTKKSLPKKFFLKGIRASDSRIHNLLSGSTLNAGNALIINLEHNYWLNRLRHAAQKSEYRIEDIVSRGDKHFYVISTEDTVAMSFLADKYKDMKFKVIHKYHIDVASYAIHKAEHLEVPLSGQYIGKEHPYDGDSLFYSKKGWNQTTQFEEFEGQMYLKYHDVSYAFDILDEKNNQIFLDMAYQFSFIVTDIETRSEIKPKGQRMNRNKPLVLQSESYDSEFWNDQNNAKLVPLTHKQLEDLAEFRPLDAQFSSSKIRRKKT